jgi:predicted nucleotidyltransferase
MADQGLDLNRDIINSVDYLRKYFNIKQVILFGSQLEKRADKFSDIDLAVISPDFSGKSYEEILNIFADLALKFGSNIELHPFSDEDLKNARPTNFLGFLLKSGKTVFLNNKFKFD